MAPPREEADSANDTSKLTDWWYRTRYQFYAPIYRFAARPLEKGRRRAIERIAPTPGERILILGSDPVDTSENSSFEPTERGREEHAPRPLSSS